MSGVAAGKAEGPPSAFCGKRDSGTVDLLLTLSLLQILLSSHHPLQLFRRFVSFFGTKIV